MIKILPLLVIFCQLSIIESLKEWEQPTTYFCKKYGYTCEEHNVETVDGYILTIFRIPKGTQKKKTPERRPPVIVQHGILSTSNIFVLRGREDFVFLMAEKGFDVWITNARGSRYSKHNSYLTTAQFYNYTLDDIAYGDLPAIIDYVLDTTNFKTLSYIGHSRGTTTMIMLLSERPEYNDKINYLGLIAPVTYLRYSKSPYLQSKGKPAAMILSKLIEYILLRNGIMKLNYLPSPVVRVICEVCASVEETNKLCASIYFLASGVDFENTDFDLNSFILFDAFSGLSLREIMQYLHSANVDEITKFDYGIQNYEVYGDSIAPNYNLSRVTCPTFLYYGPNDPFVNELDLQRFKVQLENLRGVYRVPFDKFNHLDYIIGEDTNDIFIPILLQDIINSNRKHFKNRCV